MRKEKRYRVMAGLTCGLFVMSAALSGCQTAQSKEAAETVDGMKTAKGPDQLSAEAARMTIETMKEAMGLSAGSETETDGQENSQGRIAVVRNLSHDDHTTQFFDGAVSEGKKLGYTVDTFVTDADDAVMQETLKQVIADGYDGLIISHGKEEYSTKLIQEAVDKGMKVVTFDTVSDSVEGVTATAQNDEQLAKLSLDALLASINKKPAKLIKIWYDKSMAPFSRRNVVYEEYEKQGLIETVAEIYLETPTDTLQEEVTNQLKALGNIQADGVWVAWDELAKGVYAADLSIPMASIDISDTDIQNMVSEPGKWTATAAVNARTIGEVDMQILDRKLKGEKTPEKQELEGSLIFASDLKKDSKVADLAADGF